MHYQADGTVSLKGKKKQRIFNGNGLYVLFYKIFVLIVSLLVYMCLHELVHGITMIRGCHRCRSDSCNRKRWQKRTHLDNRKRR